MHICIHEAYMHISIHDSIYASGDQNWEEYIEMCGEYIGRWGGLPYMIPYMPLEIKIGKNI